MASSLTVKAFLQREGMLLAEPEIRLFPVEASSSSDTYRALVDKVAAVFPGLTPGSFTLHWKDEDDDLVQFSTQAELLHANQFSDDIVKIYVFAAVTDTDKDEENDPATDEREAAEDGTTCHVMFETPLHAALHPNPMMGRRWGGPWGQGMRRLGKTAKLLGMKKKSLNLKKVMKAEKVKCKEFHALASQVPQAFRQWVRMYVRNWFFEGQSDATVMDAGQSDAGPSDATVTDAGNEQLPEGAPPNFRQWLSKFLALYKEQKLSETVTKGSDAEEMEVLVLEDEEQEKEWRFMLPPPEGLPPVYYQWICCFLTRFVSNHELDGSDKNPMFPGQHGGLFHGHGYHGHHHWKNGSRVQHKHGCRMSKGGKHGGHSSSESEDNRCPHEQLWTKVPKEFRIYVRMLVKQLYKNKADKPGHSVKLTAPAGMSPAATQFLQQFVQDWHAKLAEKRPHAVSMEMMAGEGTALPEGLERDHFRWLCRFMARWHRRHAGECYVMGNWSSGDTSDDTSGDDGNYDFGEHRGFHAGMMERHGFPGRGHPFHPGRGHPFHPRSTPPFPPMGFMGDGPAFGHGCHAMGPRGFGMGGQHARMAASLSGFGMMGQHPRMAAPRHGFGMMGHHARMAAPRHGFGMMNQHPRMAAPGYGFGMMGHHARMPAAPMRFGCPGRRGCFPGNDRDTECYKNQTGAATSQSQSAAKAPEADPMDHVTE